MSALGNFRFIASASWRDLLEDAYNAVTVSNAWDFFQTQAPPEDKGYMFWNTPELTAITKNMKCANLHSGGSFGSTMRAMQSIALIGWDAWVAGYTKNFTDAQDNVDESIKEEPINNGIHYTCVMRKEKFAHEMNLERMCEGMAIPKPERMSDETIQYIVAKDIESHMN